jgi:hypothetical protein
MKCNQNTPKCKNNINHPKGCNYILKKCCRRGLMAILNKIPYIFEGMDWWLEFGTLLGFIRDGKIIDWDDDLDVGIMEESLTPENIEKIKKRSEEFGLYFDEIEYNGIRKLYYSKANGLYCDVWTFKKNEDNIIYAPSSFTAAMHEEKFTKNKDALIIDNVSHNIPSDIDEFLTIRYANWKIPKKCRRSYKDGRLHVRTNIEYNEKENFNFPTILENPPKNKY